MQKCSDIVLASASPRRRELLSRICPQFCVAVADVDESIDPGTSPREAVAMLSKRKAAAVAQQLSEGTIVIGADTVVAVDDTILGKPADDADAARMLRMLSGRAHAVYTGLCVLRVGDKDVLSHVEETRVYCSSLSDEEIRAYIKTGEPYDKAGAYAIQGGFAGYITRIEGCYYNVVGLPLAALRVMLETLGRKA